MNLDRNETLSIWNTEVSATNTIEFNFWKGILLPVLLLVQSITLDAHCTAGVPGSEVEEVTETSTISLSSSSSP